MSRYIDADKFIGNLMTDHWGTTNMVEVGIALDKAVADAVEVRHGYWKWEKKIEPQAQNRLYCSICDNECLSKGNYYVYSTYCPHCGAKMDGERREG
jgi:hypothetical protein